MQNTCISSASPGKNAINYTSSFHISLTCELPVHEHTVTDVNVHYFAKKEIAEDNNLLKNVGEI